MDQVTILREFILNNPLPNGQVLQTLELTYQAVGLPPRQVYIPLAEDSPERRQTAIREDLTSAGVTRATILDIP